MNPRLLTVPGPGMRRRGETGLFLKGDERAETSEKTVKTSSGLSKSSRKQPKSPYDLTITVSRVFFPKESRM